MQCFLADDNHRSCRFWAPSNEGQNSQPHAANEWNGFLRTTPPDVWLTRSWPKVVLGNELCFPGGHICRVYFKRGAKLAPRCGFWCRANGDAIWTNLEHKHLRYIIHLEIIVTRSSTSRPQGTWLIDLDHLEDFKYISIESRHKRPHEE